MFDMLRDPRYLLPLGILVGVILASAIIVHVDAGQATGTPPIATIELPAQSTSTATVAAPAPVTPGLDDVLLDSRRALDLGELRDALTMYKKKNGAYPLGGDVVTPVCAQDSDAGCVLSLVSPGIAFTDGKLPYWYASDGETYFVVIARAQIPADESQCPASLPPALVGTPVLCLRGGGSGPR